MDSHSERKKLTPTCCLLTSINTLCQVCALHIQINKYIKIKILELFGNYLFFNFLLFLITLCMHNTVKYYHMYFISSSTSLFFFIYLFFLVTYNVKSVLSMCTWLWDNCLKHVNPINAHILRKNELSILQ